VRRGVGDALFLAIERTRYGARIRAAVDNLRMAQSVGINTSRLFTGTFALGSGLAALAAASAPIYWRSTRATRSIISSIF